MKKLIGLTLVAVLLATGSAQAGKFSLKKFDFTGKDYVILRPGEITGLDRPGCVGGFIAQTVPANRLTGYRWDNLPGRTMSYIALRDTNGDGYSQGITLDTAPQDGYALLWTQNNYDELVVRNNGTFGKVAVKIWRRC